MEYHKLELYIDVIKTYLPAFEETQDIADYVPPKTIKLMYRKLDGALRSDFGKAWWEDLKYRWDNYCKAKAEAAAKAAEAKRLAAEEKAKKKKG